MTAKSLLSGRGGGGSGNIEAARELLGISDEEDYLWWGPPPVCRCVSVQGVAHVWLFRSVLGLVFHPTGEKRLFKVSELRVLKRTTRTVFRGDNFGAPPERLVLIHIAVKSDRETIVLEFGDPSVGDKLARALDFLWRWSRTKLGERETVYIACNKLPDVLNCVSLLPVVASGVLSYPGMEDQPAVLELSLDERATLFFRRPKSELSEEKELLRTILLDNVIMLRVEKRKNLVVFRLRQPAQTFTFQVAENGAKVGAMLRSVWGLNCNSVVTFTLHNSVSKHGRRASTWHDETFRMLDDVVCFSLDEVEALLNTFQGIDFNGDGCISSEEFCESLGPVFGSGVAAQVPQAVFRVFDSDGDGIISFPEFLFGCRVLRLGSLQDRLSYQCRLFDVHGTGYITRDGFQSMTEMLSQLSAFHAPEGHTVASFCSELFDRLKPQDGTVQRERLTEALASDASFREAFASLAVMQQRLQSSTRIQAGQQVMFGDASWLTGTCILSGIQRAVQHREECRGKWEIGHAPHHAFHDKCTWSLTTGQQVQTPQPHPPPKGKPATPAHCEVFFTDYAPMVFDDLMRAAGTNLYLESLGIKQLVSSLLLGAMTSLLEVCSSGRSGAFFFASHDGRFYIKTIPAEEAAALMDILPSYYRHMTSQPESLITRYCGLHALRYADVKVHFIVMENAIQPPVGFKATEQYDLKGSKEGRTVGPDRREGVAMKDLDLKRPIVIDPDIQPLLLAQLEADSAFLREANLNDYSFLIGVHVASKPIPPPMPDTRVQVLRRWHGGFPSADHKEVFWAGIIDILTQFGLRKKAEHAGKSVMMCCRGSNPDHVSCVPPARYQERFMAFMTSRLCTGPRLAGLPAPDVLPVDVFGEPPGDHPGLEVRTPELSGHTAQPAPTRMSSVGFSMMSEGMSDGDTLAETTRNTSSNPPIRPRGSYNFVNLGKNLSAGIRRGGQRQTGRFNKGGKVDDNVGALVNAARGWLSPPAAALAP
eukprot:Hpha_TRINITY_DN19765_c0_g1::TRINITY_DN19765_c0_g1_i1::g.21762::m.21762/K00889/PIP5K; 1-phosphatidylinositol-4-phosphate 5-kinase